MNVGQTRRIQPRFRARIPLLCESRGVVHTLIPRNISTSGCYFDFNRPEFLSDGAYDIEIPLEGTSTIAVKAAEIKARPPHGFGFDWELSAEDQVKLFAFLEHKSEHPSSHAKVLFLVNEQRSYFQGFRDIAEQKQKGYRFLFGLIAAYCLYLSAPFHFDIKSVEQLAFYAVGGVWASVMLIFHCLRFLHWLGISARRKALLIHAMSANRAWVFENDSSYYAKSILPMGSRYDDARAWTPKDSIGREELFPLGISYRGSTTIFHFLVQAFFALGMVLFISILARAIFDKTLSNKDFGSGDIRLFDMSYFLASYSACSILLLGWIHACGRACGQYQRRVWEGRRISSERPNPRYTSRGLKRQQPILHHGSKIFVGLWVIYGLLAFVVTVARGLFPEWVPQHVNSWVTTTTALGLLLIGKIVYIKIQLNAETQLQKDSYPLSDLQGRTAVRPSSARGRAAGR